MNITILIRVYDRLEDLKICIEAIRKHWNLNEYYILVVSNGKAGGFLIPENIKKISDKVIELPTNSGHIKGNSQLLSRGI